MLDMGHKFSYTVEEKAALDAGLLQLGILEPAKAAVERRRSIRNSKSKTEVLKDSVGIAKTIHPSLGGLAKSQSLKPKASTGRLSRRASGMVLSEIDQVLAVIRTFEDGNSLILPADAASSSSVGPTSLPKTTMRPLNIKRKKTGTTTLNTSTRPLEPSDSRKTVTTKGGRTALLKKKARGKENIPPVGSSRDVDNMDDAASFTGAEFIGPFVSRDEHLSAPPMSFPKSLTSTDAEVPLFRLFRVHQYVRDRRIRDPPLEDKY